MVGGGQSAGVLDQCPDRWDIAILSIDSFLVPIPETACRHVGKTSPNLSSFHGVAPRLDELGRRMLAILASGTNTEKETICYTVAHYYLVFSIVQMLLLATVMGHHDILFSNLSMGEISATNYLLVGNRIFAGTSNAAYNFAMTLFMASYGVVVLWKF